MIDANHHGVRRDILATAFLIAATWVVYSQVSTFEFINFDDGNYVSRNLIVQKGLTWENIKWAFSLESKYGLGWHPLSWISHMVDCQFFDVDPGRHHLVNLFIHICNVIILLVIFRKMTGSFWRPLFVAALFALHPVNVDSVAWIAERKNLLSTFFGLFTILFWFYYCRRKKVVWYGLALLSFVLSLLSKQMFITMPFLLMLLDFWPMGRIRIGRASPHDGETTRIPFSRSVLEKAPLWTVMVIFLVIYIQSQPVSVSTAPQELVIRMENAIISYPRYLQMAVWPRDMAILYPFPTVRFPLWQVVGSSALVMLITALVLLRFKRYTYLSIGWLWYLGTLVPVLGIVQSGVWPAVADRFAYVPLIGIFVIIAWGGAAVWERLHLSRTGLIVTVSAILIVMASTTWMQSQFWKNSIVLFKHATEVTEKNYVIHTLLGVAYGTSGRLDKGIEHNRKALGIKPDYRLARGNLHAFLAMTYAERGMLEQAIEHNRKALSMVPDFSLVRFNLGNILLFLGKAEEGISLLSEAVKIDPGASDARYNLGLALAMHGKPSEGILHFRELLRQDRNNADAHFGMGIAFGKLGRIDDAIASFSNAVRIKPMFGEAHTHLGMALFQRGDVPAAREHVLRALQINPQFGDAKSALNVLDKR